MTADSTLEGMLEKPEGKLTTRDERVATILSWTPWLSFFLITVPLPVVFLAFFLAAATTDSAAVYLLLSFVSMGLGLVVGLLVLTLLLFYRRRWLGRLRDRLAADGITGAEVAWFVNELTSEERRIWRELTEKNPLLADAYCQTLANRLTATRIIARSRGEVLRVERQINRTRSLRGVDTSSLLDELHSDRQRVDGLRQEATRRLSEAKAQLQAIEASANRKLSQVETDSMLRRLAASQALPPLALEMDQLEREELRELDQPKSNPVHSN
ncbi:MAG TPA: hypothetical protein VNO50_14365 [Pyrinomonadaceae bacterium]|nr:hypothetical protein [Pyrinomonadaceae bacterium]